MTYDYEYIARHSAYARKIYKQFNNNLHMREKEYIKWKAQKVFRKNDVLIDLANKKANYSV